LAFVEAGAHPVGEGFFEEGHFFVTGYWLLVVWEGASEEEIEGGVGLGELVGVLDEGVGGGVGFVFGVEVVGGDLLDGGEFGGGGGGERLGGFFAGGEGEGGEEAEEENAGH